MVGLVIGMVAVVVIMQVFALSEGSKRTTTSGDDAQTNGAIALTIIQRDLRQAGFGTGAFPILGCNVALPAPATWTLSAMAPVTINHASIPAGDANTDTVTIVFGNGVDSTEGDRVISQPIPGPTVYTVTTPTAFAVGDRVIALPPTTPSPCNLTMEAATNVTASPPNVTVATGVAGVSNGTLYNAGPSPRVLVYAVRGGALTVCDYTQNDCSLVANQNLSTVWVPIGDNIVSLRADYGQDTSAPMDAVVDSYDRTTPTTACGWIRVSAIRIAVVARNAQVDKTTVTASAPTWAGAASAAFDLSSNTSWQNYRYRSFETTVPLRNISWQGKQSC